MGWYVVPGARVDSVGTSCVATVQLWRRAFCSETSLARPDQHRPKRFRAVGELSQKFVGRRPGTCGVSFRSITQAERAPVAATTVAAFTARLVSGTHYELSGKAPRGGRLRR